MVPFLRWFVLNFWIDPVWVRFLDQVWLIWFDNLHIYFLCCLLHCWFLLFLWVPAVRLWVILFLDAFDVFIFWVYLIIFRGHLWFVVLFIYRLVIAIFSVWLTRTISFFVRCWRQLYPWLRSLFISDRTLIGIACWWSILRNLFAFPL